MLRNEAKFGPVTGKGFRYTITKHHDKIFLYSDLVNNLCVSRKPDIQFRYIDDLRQGESEAYIRLCDAQRIALHALAVGNTDIYSKFLETLRSLVWRNETRFYLSWSGADNFTSKVALFQWRRSMLFVA